MPRTGKYSVLPQKMFGGIEVGGAMRDYVSHSVECIEKAQIIALIESGQKDDNMTDK